MAIRNNNYILFGNKKLPCTIEHYPRIRKPAPKFTRQSVPGRNGDIFIPENAFENVVVEYDVYAGNDEKCGADVSWKEMADILYGPRWYESPSSREADLTGSHMVLTQNNIENFGSIYQDPSGYQKLMDTYMVTDDGEIKYFRLGKYITDINAENSWNKFGRCTLAFDCKPERFLTDMSYQIFEDANFGDLGNRKYINGYNPTFFTSKPVIILRLGTSDPVEFALYNQIELVVGNARHLENVTETHFTITPGSRSLDTFYQIECGPQRALTFTYSAGSYYYKEDNSFFSGDFPDGIAGKMHNAGVGNTPVESFWSLFWPTAGQVTNVQFYPMYWEL